MVRVAGIHVGAHRGISDIRLPLRACNILIGANGAGKSTLLEAMGLRTTEDGALERLAEPDAVVHWYFEPDKPAALLAALRKGTKGGGHGDGLDTLAFALRAKAVSADRWELALDLFALIEGEMRSGQQSRVHRVSRQVVLNTLRPLEGSNHWVREVCRHIDDPHSRLVDLGVSCPPLAPFVSPRVISMVVDDDDISPHLYRHVLGICRSVARRVGASAPELASAVELLELGAFGPARQCGLADVVVARLQRDADALFPSFVKKSSEVHITFVDGPDSAVGLVEQMLSIVAGADDLNAEAHTALQRARLTLRQLFDTVDVHLEASVRRGTTPALEVPYSQLGTGTRRWLCGAIDEAARDLIEVVEGADPSDLLACLEAGVLPNPSADLSRAARPAMRLVDEPMACLESRVHNEVLGWLRARLDNDETLVVATHQSAVLNGLRLPNHDDEIVGVWRDGHRVRAAPIGMRMIDALDRQHSSLGLLSQELLFAARAVLAVEGHHDRVIIEAAFGAKLAESGVVLLTIGASDATAVTRAVMTTILGRLRLPMWVLLDTPRRLEGKQLVVDPDRGASVVLKEVEKSLEEWQRELLHPIDLNAVDIVATLEPRVLAKLYATQWSPDKGVPESAKWLAEQAFAECATSSEAKDRLAKLCGLTATTSAPSDRESITDVVNRYAAHLLSCKDPRADVSWALRCAMAVFFKELDERPTGGDATLDG